MGTPRQLAALSTQPTASDGEMDDAAGLVSQNEQTKSARNVAVGTTKKSIEARTPTWFSRNPRYHCDRGRPRRGRSRPTVRCEISLLSLVSSPWMRGAPP